MTSGKYFLVLLLRKNFAEVRRLLSDDNCTSSSGILKRKGAASGRKHKKKTKKMTGKGKGKAARAVVVVDDDDDDDDYDIEDQCLDYSSSSSSTSSPTASCKPGAMFWLRALHAAKLLSRQDCAGLMRRSESMST